MTSDDVVRQQQQCLCAAVGGGVAQRCTSTTVTLVARRRGTRLEAPVACRPAAAVSDCRPSSDAVDLTYMI